MQNARQRFQEQIEEKRRNQAKESAGRLRQLAQAKVPMDAITHSAEWDFFLSLLQSKVEELDALLVAIQGSTVRDPSFEHAALAASKALQMQVEAQRDTLRRVIELPKQIMDHGDKATLALQNYVDE